MRTVTFLVLEGVDKGRVYRDLPIPVTIGREEGNGLRLNDERVSRYHAKVQMEDGDDESTATAAISRRTAAPLASSSSSRLSYGLELCKAKPCWCKISSTLIVLLGC